MTKTQNNSELEKPAAPEADKAIAPDSPAATFISNLIGAKPAKPETTKPKKDDEDGDPGDGETGKPAKVEEKPAKKKQVAPAVAVAPVIDEEKLGASIGKSIAEHSAKKVESEKKAEVAPDKADAKRIAVLERMESLNGERYKGLTERYKASKIKLKQYAEEWEKANPGDKFDEDAEEHSDFIEALEAQVAYDDDDYTEALSDIRADIKLESKRSELDERLSKVERAEKAREQAPKIAEAGVSAGNSFWKDMGDDFKDVVGEKGAINGEALKAIAESDPVKYDIVIAAADAAERVAQTIYMLSNNLTDYDGKNPVHANLANFAISQEEAMLKRPVEERKSDDGKIFVRKSQYENMNAADRETHWTFTPADLTYMAVQSISTRAKAHLKAEDEKFNRRARAKGLINEEEKPEPATTHRATMQSRTTGEEQEDADSDNGGKPLSPSFSSSPKLAAGKPGNGNSAKSGAEGFIQKLIGG